jgi:hypothetical protein
MSCIRVVPIVVIHLLLRRSNVPFQPLVSCHSGNERSARRAARNDCVSRLLALRSFGPPGEQQARITLPHQLRSRSSLDSSTGPAVTQLDKIRCTAAKEIYPLVSKFNALLCPRTMMASSLPTRIVTRTLLRCGPSSKTLFGRRTAVQVRCTPMQISV